MQTCTVTSKKLLLPKLVIYLVLTSHSNRIIMASESLRTPELMCNCNPNESHLFSQLHYSFAHFK